VWQEALSYTARLCHVPPHERRPTLPFSIASNKARHPLAVLVQVFGNCGDQAVSTSLTHIDAEGTARMVDVGAKAETQRLAVASGRIRMSAEALAAIRAGDAPKGDVLGTARIAGIMAAKRTSDLIPMCHPLAIDAVNIDFAFEDAAVRATATASLTGKTGIEMEAITAVTIALVTVYDMAKALDKAMVIDDVRLIEKRGGKSGHWRASDA
jgi:cyclic pyranopterin phosphate synthase